MIIWQTILFHARVVLRIWVSFVGCLFIESTEMKEKIKGKQMMREKIEWNSTKSKKCKSRGDYSKKLPILNSWRVYYLFCNGKLIPCAGLRLDPMTINLLVSIIITVLKVIRTNLKYAFVCISIFFCWLFNYCEYY